MNGGATVGRVDAGDTVTLTYSAALLPYLVFFGWDGSPHAVIVRFDHQGPTSNFVVDDGDGTPISALGSVDLAGHYTNTVSFDATMTSSGSAITIVIGGLRNGSGLHTVSTPTTMTWASLGQAVTESGSADVDF